MDVHVRELRYFVAVADERGFTRAAERLFVSQPALSKQIRALEQQLRTRLFDRDRRSTTLTAAGRALLPHARAVVEAWDEAYRAVGDAVAADGAVLRVGFATSIGRGLLPAAQAAFIERQPGWTVRLTQVPWTDPTAGVADGSSDVALVWLPVAELEALPSEVLVTEPRWVALPAAHPLAQRSDVAFRDLLDEPFLALPESAGVLRSYWLAEDAREGRGTRIGAVVTTAEETFEAVANGTGIALLSQGNAALYQRPDVVCRPVTGLSPSRLAVVWRPDDHRAVIRDFVLACIRTADGGH